MLLFKIQFKNNTRHAMVTNNCFKQGIQLCILYSLYNVNYQW